MRPGAIADGYARRLGSIQEYVGLDVHKPSIDWAAAFLANPDRNISFRRMDIRIERYNTKGENISARFGLPASSDNFDLVTLYSVFSHMRLADIRNYLLEIRRALAPTGKVFCSLFVEYWVKDEAENPANHHRDWAGPLHWVRINRSCFGKIVYSSGLIMECLRVLPRLDVVRRP